MHFVSVLAALSKRHPETENDYRVTVDSCVGLEDTKSLCTISGETQRRLLLKWTQWVVWQCAGDHAHSSGLQCGMDGSLHVWR